MREAHIYIILFYVKTLSGGGGEGCRLSTGGPVPPSVGCKNITAGIARN